MRLSQLAFLLLVGLITCCSLASSASSGTSPTNSNHVLVNNRRLGDLITTAETKHGADHAPAHEGETAAIPGIDKLHALLKKTVNPTELKAFTGKPADLSKIKVRLGKNVDLQKLKAYFQKHPIKFTKREYKKIRAAIDTNNSELRSDGKAVAGVLLVGSWIVLSIGILTAALVTAKKESS